MTTVIFKPTEACNGNCVYCEVVRKDRERGARLPQEALERFFIRINEFLLARPEERFQIIWHGGEPLLLGPDYFMRAHEYENKHCPETKDRITHDIQTNITLFTREYAEVFRTIGISRVSTSYDPIPDVRGLGISTDSKAYNRRFMDALSLLDEEGFDWGMIYVVTKLSLAHPLDIFYFLTNLNKTGSVKFNPIYFYKRRIQELAVTPEEFVEFLGAIFPVWWEHRERFQGTRPFNSFVEAIIEGSGGLECAESGACADSHFSLGPSGTFSQCGRSSDWGLLDYGSVQDQSIEAVFTHPHKELFRSRSPRLKEGECKGCRFWELCHGGCPLDAYAETGDWLKKSPLCAYRKGFIEKYFEPITGVRYEPDAPSRVPEPADEPAEPSREVKKIVSFPSPPKNKPVWINPFGGLGDTVILSSVLKAGLDKNPKRRFNVVARTSYGELLRGHPAVDKIGNPPPGTYVVSTAYWDHPDFGGPGGRPFGILSRMLGLDLPQEGPLFVPPPIEIDELLVSRIPFSGRNVLICPSCSSPRKEMELSTWEAVVTELSAQGVFVAQAGRRHDRYVRGAFSLLGVTTPRQLIALVSRFDAIVATDNFMGPAAHLVGRPAVVLWGPTDPATFGYPSQTHLLGHRICQNPEGCLARGRATLYATRCPLGPSHCMNRIEANAIVAAVKKVLAGASEKGKAIGTGPKT